MRILNLGTHDITIELLNQGHIIVSDPSESVDAVVCNIDTYKLAPDGIPMFVLLTGGNKMMIWRVQKDYPEAHCYMDTKELINELTAKVYEVDIAELPINKQDSLIVTSYANKGGVGKTTTALSIATVVAEQGAKTVIVDMDYGGANLATFYNINREFINYIADTSLLDKALFKVQGNLYLLPSPTDIVPNSIEPNNIYKILMALKAKFQVIVCDTPPSPWDKKYIHPVYANSDIVYAVVKQEKFSIAEVKTYSPQLMAMGTDRDRMRIVLNAYNPKLMSLQQIEAAFNANPKLSKVKVSAIIPDSREDHVRALQIGEVLNKDIWKDAAAEIIQGLAGEIESLEAKKEGLFIKLKRRWSKSNT